MIKRTIISSFPKYFNQQFFKKKANPELATDLAPPVFEIRNGKFSVIDKSAKEFTLTFLNESRSYQIPINWHEEALEYGTRLWKLNLHYMEFLEEVDNEWFQWIIRDWITQNPPYKKGYWLDSWNSFALSIRVVVWMQQLAKRRDQLPDEFIDRVSESIYRQLLFLETNIENDIKGNHLIKNIKALLWGASFFQKDKKVNRWRSLGEKLLFNELEEQVLDDGLHYERSPAYHCQVLADLIECYKVLENSSLKERLKECLLKMGEALVGVTHPDGKISLFNDGGLDMAYSPDELIKALKDLIEFAPEKNKKVVLEEGGYFGLRKNDNYLLFDAGKIAPDFLPAHGHGDILSFEWSIGEQRIFIDKGVYEYNAGKKRQLSRSTKSHNTVTIGEEDQCEFWHSFRVARRANVTVDYYGFDDGIFKIGAQHDGYTGFKGEPVHCRQLEFDGTILSVKDAITGGQGQQVTARFLLAPSVKVISLNEKLKLVAEKNEIKISCEYPITVQNTEWYPNFGVEKPCKQLVIELGEAPCRASYCFQVIS
jgi:uncharacterized heparinase superfamily protein